MLRSVCLLVLVSSLISPALATNACTPAGPSNSVLTQANNNCRTAANLDETVLHTSNVDAGHFGKLGANSVDAYIFAQPLYYPSLSVNGVTHNVVFVATLNNSVYAFDADNPGSAPLWHTSVGTPYGQSAPPGQSCPSGPEPPALGTAVLGCLIGIVSTPVIDPSSNILYCVKIDSATNWWLVAIDITSGAVVRVAQIGISQTQFVGANQLQRPGLLLSQGIIYIAFGSWNDDQSRNSYGWLFAYDASNFAYVGSLVTVPISTGCVLGSIWQSGRGPAADSSGNVYFQTGNLGNGANCDSGTGYNSPAVLAEGIVAVNSTASLLDAFQPHYSSDCLNPAYCDQPGGTDGEDYNDLEVGSGGPMLLPRTDLLVGGGKMGISYLLPTPSLGSVNQRFLSTGWMPKSNPPDHPDEIHGVAYWDRATTSPLFFVWGWGDVLKSYSFDSSTQLFSTVPTLGSDSATYPGGMISVSANAGTTGTGVVWTTSSTSNCTGQGGQGCGTTFNPQPGILSAYDASDVSKRLYSTLQNASRDGLGDFAKFTPPTIANGKLFVPSLVPNQLLVYGPYKPDILAVMKTGTATNTTEVHELTVASNYAQFGLQTGTALGTTGSNWAFTTGDLDLDGRPDVVGIFENGTASGKTEVHVLGAYCSGVSGNFQGFLLNTPTALGPTDSSWEFQMADVDGDGYPDLVAIHKFGTASGKTEVTVLKGEPVGTCASPTSSSFQTIIWQGATGLTATSSSWTFRMADMDLDGKPDLVGIEENGGTSGKTELYVLSGASNFQTVSQHIVTGLGYTSSSSWDFWLADFGLDGKPDLYGIYENGTPSGKTEVWVLGSGSNYQSFALKTPTALGPTNDNFVFLAVPWRP